MKTNPSEIALIAAASFVFFFLLKKHKDTADSRTDSELKTKSSAPKNTNYS